MIKRILNGDSEFRIAVFAFLDRNSVLSVTFAFPISCVGVGRKIKIYRQEKFSKISEKKCKNNSKIA